MHSLKISKMNISSILLSSLLLVAAASCLEGSQLNIVELARRLGIYSYLFALEETDNTGLVSNTDNITVFIPSNEAFKNVPENTRDYWRKNPAHYQNLMRYHVVKGRFNFKDFKDETLYDTYASPNLTGRFVNYTGFSNDVKSFTGAVIDPDNTDYQASNGVIHFLKDVVEHMQTGTLLETALNMTELSTVLQGVSVAGLNETLSGNHSLTFFAPTNDAITKYGKNKWENLIKNPKNLTDILSFHIASAGAWFSAGLVDKLPVGTLNKLHNLTIHVNNKGVQVNEAQVLLTDIAAVNGVIHTIDTLLVP